MRFPLVLLLLFGAIIGICDATECKIEKSLYVVHQTEQCEATITWKVRDHEQATSVCLEYFPTTFVKGEKLSGTNDGKIKCTVEPAYQCVAYNGIPASEFHLIYDKCYYFPMDSSTNKPRMETMDEYLKLYDASDEKKGREVCKGGKLSVFYSYTHAKFVGMKAHVHGIDKLWIGITKDGKSIENPTQKVHDKLWKLIDDDYWNGDQLKTFSNNQVPAEANYFFMRTRTDNFYNRFQGSFERATKNVKATFACEFEAKFTEHQKWYCDKLPQLGIASVYDTEDHRNGGARCMYISANKYTFNGKKEDLDNIKGCQERPSELHYSGLDDGSATVGKYATLTQGKGRLRLSGFMQVDPKDANYGHHQVNIVKGTPFSTADMEKVISKWRFYDHHGKVKYGGASQLEWQDKNPKNENSDFPGLSTTMGVENGKVVDVPPEARLPAVCSISFFQECENRIRAGGAKKPCKDSPEPSECRNTKQFETKTGGFYTCNCPGPEDDSQTNLDPPFDAVTTKNWKKKPYVLENGKCKWNHENSLNYCAWMHFHICDWNTKVFKDTRTAYLQPGIQTNFHEYSGIPAMGQFQDMMDQVVVKEGCTMTVFSHESTSKASDNFKLLSQVGPGTHDVPNWFKGTLGDRWRGMSATSAQCWCS